MKRMHPMLVALAFSACDCDDGDGLTDVTPDLAVAPEAIDFGEVTVGDFRVRALELSNKGLLGLRFAKIELVAGEFTFASPLPEALGPEQSIRLTLNYQPRDAGEDLAVVRIVAEDLGERLVMLRGVGVIGDLSVRYTPSQCGETPTAIAFGTIAPGRTSTRTITLAASGGAPVQILSVALEPGLSTEFSVTNVPANGFLLAPGESKDIVLAYAPVDGGPDQGALIITSDAVDRPSIRVVLCGSGSAPAICARPNPLDLGTAIPGTALSGTLTLESCSDEPLEVRAIALSMDASNPSAPGFTLSGAPSLPTTLAPAGTHALTIAYTPPAVGRAMAWVRVESNATGNSPAYFPVSARGADPCAIQLAPSELRFSNVAAGGRATRAVLVANDGATPCTVSRAEITAGAMQFGLQSPPSFPHTIAPGASLILDVSYTPSAQGSDMGTLTVEEGGIARTVPLFGNTPQPGDCQLEVVPAFLNFGVVAPGTVRTLGIAVNNLSDTVCTIRGTELERGTDPELTDTSQNFGLILPNRTKQLSVTYRPGAAGGMHRGALLIRTSDVDTPNFRVPLAAASGTSGICVDPLHLPFGPTRTIETLDFTIYACGNRAVTVQALDWVTPDAEITLAAPAPTLPFTLQPGASRAVTVRFAPMDQVGDLAVVAVRSDDVVSPSIEVRVTGGPEIVPAAAGRYLYFWQIPTPIGGDIVRLPLQGNTTLQPYWGPRTGKQCAGCHEVSPDGRYVALIEIPNLRVVDTTTDIALSLPSNLLQVEYMTWRPDTRTTPPYQFAYAFGGKIHIAGLFDGNLRELTGANNVAQNNSMPSWGPNGQIAVVQGMTTAGSMGGGTGFSGPTNVVLVPENGGAAVPLAGASANGAANYYPRFSPNGRWIAITRSRSAQSTISAADARVHLVRADNSGTVLDLPNANSAAGDGASSYATWSVDGRFISFSSDRAGGAGGWDIYVAPIDPTTGMDGAATNVRQANGPGFEHAAQWSP